MIRTDVPCAFSVRNIGMENHIVKVREHAVRSQMRLLFFIKARIVDLHLVGAPAILPRIAQPCRIPFMIIVHGSRIGSIVAARLRHGLGLLIQIFVHVVEEEIQMLTLRNIHPSV